MRQSTLPFCIGKSLGAGHYDCITAGRAECDNDLKMTNVASYIVILGI